MINTFIRFVRIWMQLFLIWKEKKRIWQFRSDAGSTFLKEIILDKYIWGGFFVTIIMPLIWIRINWWKYTMNNWNISGNINKNSTRIILLNRLWLLQKSILDKNRKKDRKNQRIIKIIIIIKAIAIVITINNKNKNSSLMKNTIQRSPLVNIIVLNRLR